MICFNSHFLHPFTKQKDSLHHSEISTSYKVKAFIGGFVTFIAISGTLLSITFLGPHPHLGLSSLPCAISISLLSSSFISLTVFYVVAYLGKKSAIQKKGERSQTSDGCIDSEPTTFVSKTFETGSSERKIIEENNELIGNFLSLFIKRNIYESRYTYHDSFVSSDNIYKNDIKIIYFNLDVTFELRNNPTLVFKFCRKGSQKRISNRELGLKVIKELNLDRLLVPQIATFKQSVTNPFDKSTLIIEMLAEEKMSWEEDQDVLWEQTDDDTKELIRQLVIFIALTGYCDVTFQNNPIKMIDGKKHICLLDFGQLFDTIDESFFGDGKLISVVHEEMIPFIFATYSQLKEPKKGFSEPASQKFFSDQKAYS